MPPRSVDLRPEAHVAVALAHHHRAMAEACGDRRRRRKHLAKARKHSERAARLLRCERHSDLFLAL